jgi:hypothetical protein
VGKSGITRAALEAGNETCKKRRKRDTGKEQQEEARGSAEGEMDWKDCPPIAQGECSNLEKARAQMKAAMSDDLGGRGGGSPDEWLLSSTIVTGHLLAGNHLPLTNSMR